MKSSDAYKTIGEVSELIKIPQHILRFWEESFAQIKPLKEKVVEDYILKMILIYCVE